MLPTKTLREILHEMGDKSYDIIDVRTFFKETPRARKQYEMLAGRCRYDATTQTLTSLDRDNYSLDDRYYKWEEEVIEDEVSLNVYYESNWIRG